MSTVFLRNRTRRPRPGRIAGVAPQSQDPQPGVWTMTDIQHQQLLTELLNEIGRADSRFEPPQEMEERVLKYWDGDGSARATRIRRKPRMHVGIVPGVAGALVAAVL